MNLNKDNLERGPGTYIVNKFLRRVLYTQKLGARELLHTNK